MQMSWGLFFFSKKPPPPPPPLPLSPSPPFPYCHSEPSQLGTECSPSSLCRHGPGCSGPQQPVDAVDAPTQRKCRGKLNFFHNILWNCHLINATVATTAQVLWTKTMMLTMTSIPALWSCAMLFCCGFFLKPDHCPLGNWMRLACSNHRGWRVFLVHLFLMTGQQSGWKGNRTGKFSTLLVHLCLRICPEKFPLSLSMHQCSTQLYSSRAYISGISLYLTECNQDSWITSASALRSYYWQ